MILYHFTAPRFLTGIQEEGISKGMTPVNFKGHTALVMGQQWLTAKKEFHQEWCENSSLPYDRSGARLTVKIPKEYIKNLMTYEEYSQWLGESKLEYFDKDDAGNFCSDSLNWHVYQGTIPTQWIKKINYKRRIAK